MITKRAQLEEWIPTWLQRIYVEHQPKLSPNIQSAAVSSESHMADAASVTIHSSYAAKPSQAESVVLQGHGLDRTEDHGRTIKEPLQRVRRVPLGVSCNSPHV